MASLGAGAGGVGGHDDAVRSDRQLSLWRQRWAPPPPTERKCHAQHHLSGAWQSPTAAVTVL